MILLDACLSSETIIYTPFEAEDLDAGIAEVQESCASTKIIFEIDGTTQLSYTAESHTIEYCCEAGYSTSPHDDSLLAACQSSETITYTPFEAEDLEVGTTEVLESCALTTTIYEIDGVNSVSETVEELDKSLCC